MADQRIFTRIPFVQSIKWQNISGEQGAAEVQNVGRGGIGLLSNSYLRPGPMVTLLFDDLEFENEPISLQALIAWCRPDEDPDDAFRIGLSWVHGERRTLPIVNEVFYSAIHQQYAVDQCAN